MSDPNQPTTPAGWFPDGQGGQRWWDGTQWTEHTQPGAGGADPEPPATPSAPQIPGDQATVVAPNRAADYNPGSPSGQPAGGQQGYGQQGQQGQQGYGQGGQGGQQGQLGYGQPGQPGQQQPYGGGYGQPPYGGPGGGSHGAGGGKGKGKLIAIILGALLALILVAVIIFVALKAIGGGSPDAVAEDYLKAGNYFDPDFQKECELLAEESQKSLLEDADADDCDAYAEKQQKEYDEQIGEKLSEDEACDKTFEDIQGDFDYDVEIKDVKEDGDKATADYTVTTRFTGDKDIITDCGGDEDDVEDSEDDSLELVKEDGDWKVDTQAGSESDGSGSDESTE